ncbi:pyridoxamine 5'-phosphate oxidase family protein [Geobacter sp. DSM 9736]|uniref:pyridoxamine 5'-phosphate oxidase family protein n=1 Tax=Geobacter sp. DSM 9736 TaxID=1277350 RepID=UPI000B501123|nr:pyridoxamine 5'-phosphate oxidase family protein [Geobacter sp. DSM 9736]SNB45216.1 hypothetical protein SAMN06269301_0619 [Geobacter sp. DSM 9736]
MVISDEIRKYIENARVAFVASTDEAGAPHLAAGVDLKVQDERTLLFENWFCTTTLRNVALNPRVAVAVTDPDGGRGYQLTGVVRRSIDEAVMNGFAPGAEMPGTPQILVRMVVEVDRVMDFSAGAHTDQPLR